MSREHGYQPPPHRGPTEPWPDTEYDAALHLLDRQVVDVDGRHVAKVSDVELTEDPDGGLVPTGLLVGTPALLPRFGGRLGAWLMERYVQSGTSRADRDVPLVIDMDRVDDVTSEVHLDVERDGLLRRRADPADAPVRRRLGTLLAMRVVPADGDVLHVLDAHLTAPPDQPGRHRVVSLVVGHGRPGSLLGYDRRREQGPWLVATAVRHLHRHTRLVELGPEVAIDWEQGEVRVGAGAEVRPLLD
ncbi:sporulation protein YlmC with PRC-barrel domain [Nocardioides thalensis]|uniref:Sporulation protein YlmC with PRC-barrel domain n=1 Tax=Nocardioides thalensis TaxID=1914755 RepID=A0A853BYF1_9ACTN|nr:hypothetical protein [Nocardioides thalensis]NYI99866.1 sporulation protein YlmC with PRC-barrel domain [Nocardioides thalensis]